MTNTLESKGFQCYHYQISVLQEVVINKYFLIV